MTMIEPTSATPAAGFGPVEPSAPVRRRQEVAPAALTLEDIPAAPPQEVLDDLDTAARVLHELAARQIELHFSVDERTSRVHVEVRDANGNVLRRIPSTQALDLLAGEPGGMIDGLA